MEKLPSRPKLVEQVYEAILIDIIEGRISDGEHIAQQKIASRLGVSRQPVQQALMLLRNKGILVDATGRGLIVEPLCIKSVENAYEIRAVLEGLAFRKAADHNVDLALNDGLQLLELGHEAINSDSVSALIAADREFHLYVCKISGNPLIQHSVEENWISIQRAMGKVMTPDRKLFSIFDQHEKMLSEIALGRGNVVEKLAREHVMQEAHFIINELRSLALKPVCKRTA